MPEPPDVTDLTSAPDRWAAQGEDLRSSLIVLAPGRTMAGHVNHEVDIVLLGISGRGTVAVGTQVCHIGPSTLVLVPKGAHRQLAADPQEGLRVLVVHRRTAVSGAWRWRPRRRRPWGDDPWEDERAGTDPG